MKEQNEIVSKVLSAESKEELQEAYKEWASEYDRDLNNEGYMAPENAVNIFSRYVDIKDNSILDAGCGTGLVGIILSKKGYTSIDGMDYSPDMLKVAAEKKVYNNLSQGDLTARLDLPDNAYDSIISVGAFTSAHVGPEALDELIRVTKPGGYICFTVRDTAWSNDNYSEKTKELEETNRWKSLEVTECDYIKKENSSCNICVYQVL